MFEKKFGIGALMGAAALAACSPEESKKSVEEAQTSSVMIEDGKGNVEITLPQETVDESMALPPQYTPEQEAKILSGTTAENDSMGSGEIEKLTPSE